MPTHLPADRVKAIEALRRLRMTAAEIAECLCDGALHRLAVAPADGLGKLSRLEPPEPPNRYERKRPGELIHVDVKKLGRIDGSRASGHRATAAIAARERHRGYGIAGWEFVHVCVDDATRLAYVEVLADERGETAAGFLRRAVAWFSSMGISVERVMSDNGSCYRSTVHAAACRELGLRHLRTQPYRPRTNGKAERFIQTLRRWAYGAIYAHLSRAHHSPTGLARPTTTSTDDMAPSPTRRPQLGSPSSNNVRG